MGLYHCDFLENDITDKSANLIMADPPYYRVKGDFDFKWPDFKSYLQDVEKWAKECKRILADNGSIFWWGHAKKIAYSQMILDKYFNLENSMIWEKIDSMQYQYYSPDLARTFNTHNERLLFYSNNTEQYIKSRNPFSIYLKQEFEKANINNIEIAKLFPSKTGGLTGCVSNWLNSDNIITKEQYQKIREYLNNEYLRVEYEDLRIEYEDLRRPFNNVYKLTDVLKASQESHISSQYNHETIKPLILTKKLIQITTRKNDIVVIPFGGSGTEVEACINTGRKYICYEIDKKHFQTIKDREKISLSQGILF